METYFEVGQTVYHPTWGEGIVRKISTDKDYPVEVSFKSNTHHFTENGRFIVNSDVVTLSQTPIPPIINTPIVRFEEGELVFAYVGDCWILCYYYQPVGTLLSVYKQNTQGKLLYATEVKKITDIPLPLKIQSDFDKFLSTP